ncbi:protein of unknown function [Burkholderia multivorans]
MRRVVTRGRAMILSKIILNGQVYRNV